MQEPMSLDSLPPEILQNIASHLPPASESRRSGAVAFASVNRQCRSAAVPFVFTVADIFIETMAFRQVVEQRHHQLRDASFLKHLRTLTIGCATNLLIPTDHKDWESVVDFVANIPRLDDIFFEPEDLSKTEATAFPPCVFDALLTHHPRCRLHLRVSSVWLRDLYLPQKNSYKLRLITSPIVHSITMAYRSAGGHGFDDQLVFCDQELRYVVGVAPNIKHVKITRHALYQDFQEYMSEVSGEWPGFDLKTPPAPNSAFHNLDMPGYPKMSGMVPLESLHLGSYDCLTNRCVEGWMSMIDPYRLRVLKLKSFIFVSCIPKEQAFPALEEVAISLNLAEGEDFPEDVEASWDAFECMLQQSCRIKSLEIESAHRLLPWPRLLQRLGHTLEVLRLPKGHSRSGGYIASMLKKYCPHIKELQLTIRRTKGDEREVQTYRTIGSLPKLESVNLSLDASNTSLLRYVPARGTKYILAANDPTFSEFEQKRFAGVFGGIMFPRNGHMLDALINSACDEYLGRAIFDCIYNAQPVIGSHRKFSQLRVGTIGGLDIGGLGVPRGYSQVFSEISQSWYLTRPVGKNQWEDMKIFPDIRDFRSEFSDDEEEDYESEEEEPTDDETPEYQPITHAYKAEDSELAWASRERGDDMPKELGILFRRLWPESSGRGWEDDWTAFPLACNIVGWKATDLPIESEAPSSTASPSSTVGSESLSGVEI